MAAGETVQCYGALHQTASFFTASRHLDKARNSRQKEEQNSPKKAVCAFCNGQHFSNDCEKVKSIKHRLDVVKCKRLCYNCLGSHQVSACKSHYRCRNCKRKHHTSICEQQATYLSLNPNARPFSATNQQDTAILHATTLHRPHVLLKTTVAKVSSRHSSTFANILFVEGALAC